MADNAIAWSTLYGRLYFFLANQLITVYGQDGENRVRNVLTDYGYFRAHQLRRKHEEAGLPINLHSMMNYEDMPGDSLEGGAGRISSPALHHSIINDCTLFRTWRELGLRIGRIYCSTIHHPMYTGYADGVTLNLPKYLTKYDDCCQFDLTMSEADPRIEISRDAVGYPWETLPEAMARLSGIMYLFFARSFCELEDGYENLSKALENFSFYRSAQISQPKNNGLRDLISEFRDVDYGKAIQAEISETSIKKLELKVNKCSFCQGFHEGGDIDGQFGINYCRIVHGGLFSAVPGIHTEVKKSMADGDDFCLIQLTYKE